jgi:hypothetical protein
MRLRLCLLLSLTLCWPTVGFAFTADKRDTLRGLTEVSVLVEYLPDDVEREGLSREHLTRDIEARLRQAGLRVLTISEIAKSPATWEGPTPPSSLGAPRVPEIRSRISTALERFIIDYQAVNLK